MWLNLGLSVLGFLIFICSYLNEVYIFRQLFFSIGYENDISLQLEIQGLDIVLTYHSTQNWFQPSYVSNKKSNCVVKVSEQNTQHLDISLIGSGTKFWDPLDASMQKSSAE